MAKTVKIMVTVPVDIVMLADKKIAAGYYVNRPNIITCAIRAALETATRDYTTAPYRILDKCTAAIEADRKAIKMNGRKLISVSILINLPVALSWWIDATGYTRIDYARYALALYIAPDYSYAQEATS